MKEVLGKGDSDKDQEIILKYLKVKFDLQYMAMESTVQSLCNTMLRVHRNGLCYKLIT